MLLTDLIPGLIVASAIAPALLLLWLVVAADSRPEPPRIVWISVVLGAVSCIPAALLELWLQRHVPITGATPLGAFATALLFAGIPEESIKGSIIAAIALRARDFEEPMDGVVYGTAVGLGFAAVENLLYVASNTNWAFVAVMRGVLSVPGHGAFGAIAGAYIARARFGGALGAHRTSHWRRLRLFFFGVVYSCRLAYFFRRFVVLVGQTHTRSRQHSRGCDVVLADAAYGARRRIWCHRVCGTAGPSDRPPTKGLAADQAFAARPLARCLGSILAWPRREFRCRRLDYSGRFECKNRGVCVADYCCRDFQALR